MEYLLPIQLELAIHFEIVFFIGKTIRDPHRNSAHSSSKKII